jgi:TonB family protein
VYLLYTPSKIALLGGRDRLNGHVAAPENGIFHLVLASTTGAVIHISISKSTGYPTLDSAAVSALKQWRFKPGSWNTLDIPVQFRRARSHEQYRQRIREDQEWGRQL